VAACAEGSAALRRGCLRSLPRVARAAKVLGALNRGYPQEAPTRALAGKPWMPTGWHKPTSFTSARRTTVVCLPASMSTATWGSRVGKPRGGRLIWQLADSADLRIAYIVLPNTIVPRDVEKQMIDGFRHCYGKPPFANDPHRLGR